MSKGERGQKEVILGWYILLLYWLEFVLRSYASSFTTTKKTRRKSALSYFNRGNFRLNVSFRGFRPSRRQFSFPFQRAVAIYLFFLILWSKEIFRPCKVLLIGSQDTNDREPTNDNKYITPFVVNLCRHTHMGARTHNHVYTLVWWKWHLVKHFRCEGWKIVSLNLTKHLIYILSFTPLTRENLPSTSDIHHVIKNKF